MAQHVCVQTPCIEAAANQADRGVLIPCSISCSCSGICACWVVDAGAGFAAVQSVAVLVLSCSSTPQPPEAGLNPNRSRCSHKTSSTDGLLAVYQCTITSAWQQKWQVERQRASARGRVGLHGMQRLVSNPYSGRCWVGMRRSAYGCICRTCRRFTLCRQKPLPYQCSGMIGMCIVLLWLCSFLPWTGRHITVSCVSSLNKPA